MARDRITRRDREGTQAQTPDVRRREFLVSSAAVGTLLAFGNARAEGAADASCDPDVSCTPEEIESGLHAAFKNENGDTCDPAESDAVCLDGTPDELRGARNVTTAILMDVLWTEFGRGAQENKGLDLEWATIETGQEHMRGNVWDQAGSSYTAFAPKELALYRQKWRAMGKAADQAADSAGRTAISPADFVEAWNASELPFNDKPMEGEKTIDRYVEQAGFHIWYSFGKGIQKCAPEKDFSTDIIPAGRLLSRVHIKRNMTNCRPDYGQWIAQKVYEKVSVCGYFGGRRAARLSKADPIDVESFKTGWCEVSVAFANLACRIENSGNTPPPSVACA